MTVEEVNALSTSDFNAKFDFLFEHSPWIVAAAEARRPFASIAAMEAAFADVIEEAGEAKQIALLRAHPELAGKAAIAKELTDASTAEQASAGLDRLSPDEYALFHQLNDAYRTRFGFPFIIAVRTTTKRGILTAMHDRAANDVPAEIATARGEIAKIVHLRLADALA
ncbi:2-oxo-4-hydroxy-4-carboxy-5-ureidoimidazoline decarboxylase [Sphingomonas montanisoli]|uniref:2-oxo-4-hydroxy-4-carboxy-5-ureidoimidazoline decarboxylase n=1 Tax=Sphingomonas montanisoli TaxID=2606412 RepID=A0A5D9C7W0_9SPHN|nr:2-oxo-4-hydroxy-4-carboxy-5-ureidoimidazoline decarboxylase [Sphingomonas montanisoli]TZG27854.1 2-oxo-4-hydroxy-4-carboxy-5-ureidoimidazoline decarboxylase [Sphingomonas montanisoli]